jgi:hypothetical protein
MKFEGLLSKVGDWSQPIHGGPTPTSALPDLRDHVTDLRDHVCPVSVGLGDAPAVVEERVERMAWVPSLLLPGCQNCEDSCGLIT